ncbi:MAG: hypothetical protein A3E25_00150 [Burkholderiales bacterium RIFCSPHIGHO2_12_FULL_69_20]|nr:MAG: hypothetical protein A3E25_00150 [Burkholderiales bacterium RIFCSPHIGHO2_12_FULL_69_20]
MTTPRFLAPGQHLFSLMMAAAITSAVLLSLGAQADEQHAGALMSSQVAAGQQLCAAPARAERS